MPGLGRDVSGDAVIERATPCPFERRRRRRRSVAVEHDWDRSTTRLDNGGRQRDELGAADLAQHLERIVDRREARLRVAHRVHLGEERVAGDARSQADPSSVGPRYRHAPRRRRPSCCRCPSRPRRAVGAHRRRHCGPARPPPRSATRRAPPRDGSWPSAGPHRSRSRSRVPRDPPSR